MRCYASKGWRLWGKPPPYHFSPLLTPRLQLPMSSLDHRLQRLEQAIRNRAVTGLPMIFAVHNDVQKERGEAFIQSVRQRGLTGYDPLVIVVATDSSHPMEAVSFNPGEAR